MTSLHLANTYACRRTTEQGPYKRWRCNCAKQYYFSDIKWPIMTDYVRQKKYLGNVKSSQDIDFKTKIIGVPKGIRTPVTAVKGRCPRPTRRWGHCFNRQICGVRRDRTADLNTASVALSQLSYDPPERERTLIKQGMTVKQI